MNNRYHTRSRESGQFLVILVVGLVGLIGFAALAIDGGMVFSDRRNDQNGADAAARAGGWEAIRYMETNNIDFGSFSCDKFDSFSDPVVASGAQAAVVRANDNNFTILKDYTSPSRVWFSNCVNGQMEKHVDVNVQIYQKVQTSLIHLVYQGDVSNTVTSVIRIYPPHPIGYGAAIASLSPYCGNPGGQVADLDKDGGIRWDGGGNGSTIIHGGGIFSNSCLSAAGSPVIEAYHKENPTDPSSPYHIAPDGTIAFHWPTASGLTGSNVNFEHTQPFPRHSDDFLDTVTYSPKCKTDEDVKNSDILPKAVIIGPGTYKNGIDVKNSEILLMKPGLYCIEKKFNVNAGGEVYVTLDGTNPVYDVPDPLPLHKGVTIYMKDGWFDASGAPTITLFAANDPADANGEEVEGQAIKGLLIYSPPDNLNQINMGGSGVYQYEGTVYAPRGWVSIGGSDDVKSLYTTEIIAWVVVLNGNTNINIHYDPSLVDQQPASLDQYE